MTVGFKLEVVGDARKLDQIFMFDKTLFKEIQAEVREATKDTIADAKSAYPDDGLSNWGGWITSKGGRDLSYNGSSVRAGVRSSIRSRRYGRQFRNITALIFNKDRAGSVYGLAGTIDQFEVFNRMMNRKRGGTFGSRGKGMWPRALGPSRNKNLEKARRDIARAVERGIAKANRNVS